MGQQVEHFRHGIDRVAHDLPRRTPQFSLSIHLELFLALESKDRNCGYSGDRAVGGVDGLAAKFLTEPG